MKNALAIIQFPDLAPNVKSTVQISKEIMQVWFTAREIAVLAKRSGLKDMPSDRSAINRYIQRHEWNLRGSNRVRKREGSAGGGGFEYHWNLFPDYLRAYMLGQYQKKIELADRHSHQALEETRQKEISTSDLTGRQRGAMNARAALLNVVEHQQINFGQSRRASILWFINQLKLMDGYLAYWKALQNDDDGNGTATKYAEMERVFGEIECPIKDVAKGEFVRIKHEYITTTLELVARANDRSASNCTVSLRTMQLWYKSRDEDGVAALAPRPTKLKDPLPVWFDGFMVFYCRPQKPSVARSLRNYEKSLPDPSSAPNYDQVQRALKKLDTTPEKGGTITRHRGREGKLALKARMAYVTRSTAGMLPTFVYTADGQTFDAEIAHPIHGEAFRPEITSILDVATRKNVGWRASLSENTITVMGTLSAASKNHGIAAIFYVDRGPGYKNDIIDNKVSGFCARLGTTKLHALPRNAQAKGLIERYNGTVLVPSAKEFDTYIGADMDREAGQKIHKITRKEIKEFGVSKTLPSFQAFLQAMQSEVDDYNNRPHSALDGMSPNEAWNMHVADGFEPVLVSDVEAETLFRPHVRCKTRRSLIRWQRNDYFHIALEAYHGREVLLGYDNDDGDHIWVSEITTDQHGEEVPGKLICIALFAGNEERYIPQTVQNAANEQRHKQRKRRLEDHMAEVDAELSPVLQITANQQPTFDVSAGPELIAIDGDIIAPKPAKSSQSKTPKKQRFSTDEELALWAIENPTKLSSNQIRVLRGCLSSQTAMELFRMSGIDVERLKSVIRACA